jgi:hypothetical protein
MAKWTVQLSKFSLWLLIIIGLSNLAFVGEAVQETYLKLKQTKFWFSGF